jgi:peptidyl-lysine (3S)-dioxygenase / protease
LLSPAEVACVNEQPLIAARYVPYERNVDVLVPKDDDPSETVFWPTLDPDSGRGKMSNLGRMAKPLRVTLNPGDMLYLPAKWYAMIL